MRWIDLESLNKSQREAVLENSRNLLIVAGAGSGKTKTLTYKIAYVMSEFGLSPRDVVTITFTNKAARELKERTASLLGEDISGMYIGTFHSVALRLLRESGIRPMVYDRKDQVFLVKDILKEFNLDPKKFTPGRIVSSISFYKSHMKGWKDVEEESPFEEVLAKVFRRYEERLAGLNGVDFDDIILRCIEFLGSDGGKRTFPRVFIDEYQDTNKPQHMFVKMLSQGDGLVCAVGDEDQSIYGFRGADIGNILRFTSEFADSRVVKLEKNYRSGKRILEIANRVISRNTLRSEKVLYSDIEGGNVDVVKCGSEFEEAEFITERIIDLVNDGISPGDIGILCRTNFQMYPIEKVLLDSSVPYTVVGSIRFFERKEIKDLVSFVRLAVEPADDISFVRAVTSYPQGIGKSLLDVISNLASEAGVGYFEASLRLIESGDLGGRQIRALRGFIERIDCIRKLVDESESTVEFLEGVFEVSGYIKYLENAKEFGKIENVMALKDTEYSTVGDFVDRIALADYSDEGSRTGAVNLMTIHAAKGLEFHTVFVPGMEEGLFPNDHLVVSEMQVEEERRLFYVAVTRAKRNLLLSYAMSRKRGGQYYACRPSRFLGEVTSDGCADIGVGDRVFHSLYGKGVVLGVRDEDDKTVLIINFFKYGVKELLSRDVLLHSVDVEEAYG